jgi:hypothetical protein
MKKHKNNLKLDAWDFIPGKSPVGDMASVNIPKKNIIWLAHSGSGRLDIGLAGGVVHLLQRDSEKTVATSEERWVALIGLRKILVMCMINS